MKLIARQKIWLTIVLITNGVLWAIPSDVVEQIARDEHTLLGRYSRTHFAWNLGVLLLSAVSFYVDWSTGRTYKRRWFQVAAVSLFLMPSLVLLDFFARRPDRQHYVRRTQAYHRPAHFAASAEYVDRPKAYRTYPHAPAGYPPIQATLTTDSRGFRNRAALDHCDVVVLGDSFAEGSNVSDEHCWPVQLGSLSGLTVYNLGMSGYDASNYLSALHEVGLSLRPRWVVCMLYEGNDFRRVVTNESSDPTRREVWRTYFKQSPLLEIADRMMVETFGRINSHGPVHGAEILDWMPLAIPPGSGARHYAFEPKQLRDMYVSPEHFRSGAKWLSVREQLDKLSAACRAKSAELIIAYAPTKAAVTLPLVGSRLPADHVRRFAAIGLRDDLPPAEQFLTELLVRASSRERVVAEWCASQAIPFASISEPLRGAAAAGTQVYFTYDQHWTPQGHTIAAQTIRPFLQPTPDDGTGPVSAQEEFSAPSE